MNKKKRKLLGAFLILLSFALIFATVAFVVGLHGALIVFSIVLGLLVITVLFVTGIELFTTGEDNVQNQIKEYYEK